MWNLRLVAVSRKKRFSEGISALLWETSLSVTGWFEDIAKVNTINNVNFYVKNVILQIHRFIE